MWCIANPVNSYFVDILAPNHTPADKTMHFIPLEMKVDLVLEFSETPEEREEFLDLSLQLADIPRVGLPGS